MSKPPRRIFIVIALIAASLPALASAHEEATGIVKERMDSMKDMGKALKTVSKILSGDGDYSITALEENGKTIAGHSGASLTKLFPKGSLNPPSEARPEIWSDWSAFQKNADDLNKAALGFVKTVQDVRAAGKKALESDPVVRGSFGDTDPDLLPPSGDQVDQLNKALMTIGAACKTCHEKFRLKKEKK